MLGFMKGHPYFLAIAIAVLTATLSWAYSRTISADPDETRKVFNKTLAAALVASLALTWIVHRQEPLSVEPFTAE